jgi:hypothetical protein
MHKLNVNYLGNCCEKDGAMSTLVVGMADLHEKHGMSTQA